MKCTRCCGLMVVDDLLDLQESYVSMWMRVLRCIACGNIVDPVITRHRAIRLAQVNHKIVELPRPTPLWPRSSRAA